MQMGRWSTALSRKPPTLRAARARAAARGRWGCRAACMPDPSLGAPPAKAAPARGTAWAQPLLGHTLPGKRTTDFSLALLPFPEPLAGARDVLVGPGSRHLLLHVTPSAQSTPGDPHGSKLSTSGGPANRGVGLSPRRSVTNRQRRQGRALVGRRPRDTPHDGKPAQCDDRCSHLRARDQVEQARLVQ
jgi:hypothetical protein